MAKISFNDYQANSFSGSSNVGFFSLQNDGDEAIVRILHDSVDSFDIVSVHDVPVQGRNRKVDCLRTMRDPLDKCPFCSAGHKTFQRFYIHLLRYDKDPSTGDIIVSPQIWERSASYGTTLKNLMDEYGPLSECIFKVRRNGAKGDLHTTYSIMFGNPAIYKEEFYPKDVSLFDDYSVVGSVVMSKTADEMNYYIQTGDFESSETVNESTSSPQQQAPTSNTNFMNRSTIEGDVPWKTNNPSVSKPQRFY